MPTPTKTDAVLVAVGIILAVFLAAKVPSIVAAFKPNTLTATATQTPRIENISGIDLNALMIARQNGY